MIVTCRQMQEIEAAAFSRGVTAADLMECAGIGIANVVRQFFPKPGGLRLFLGKGNNAGDALVAARELCRDGWSVSARLAFDATEFKELPARHWRELSPHLQVDESDGPLVSLDGLLGIGATGPLAGRMLELTGEMNDLRQSRHAMTIAMDIPSGLNGDTGQPCAGCVRADITATVAHVKAGLLSDVATAFVGRLAVVPLADLATGKGDASTEILLTEKLRASLPRRSFDFHKGEAGRVGIVAGSRGFLGAALLASEAAVRGGAGLVSLLVKEDVYPLLAAKAPVEVMVRVVKDYREVLEANLDALAIGPGLGFEYESEVMDLIRQAPQPCVIDADALTMLARSELDVVLKSDHPRLLTPHPGEVARFFPAHPHWADLPRRELAEAFARSYPDSTLLLKGSRTVIAESGKATAFNTTGSPAMASGGMGDVLTGLCAALIAQGLSAFDAACLGAWLSGRSAELVLTAGRHSIESLAASDLIGGLGAAFNDLKSGVF